MTDGRTDRRTDRRTDEQTNGRTDGSDCNIPDAFLKKRGDKYSTNYASSGIVLCCMFTQQIVC